MTEEIPGLIREVVRARNKQWYRWFLDAKEVRGVEFNAVKQGEWKAALRAEFAKRDEDIGINIP